MPSKKSNKKSRTLSKKSKNNNIRKFTTNKFMILAFVAVIAVTGVFVIYQSRAAEDVYKRQGIGNVSIYKRR